MIGIGEEIARTAEPYLEVWHKEAYHIFVAPNVKDFLQIVTLKTALANEGDKL